VASWQVGDNIFIVEERVRRLADRLKKWVHLRRTPPKVQLVTSPSIMNLLKRGLCDVMEAS